MRWKMMVTVRWTIESAIGTNDLWLIGAFLTGFWGMWFSLSINRIEKAAGLDLHEREFCRFVSSLDHEAREQSSHWTGQAWCFFNRGYGRLWYGVKFSWIVVFLSTSFG